MRATMTYGVLPTFEVFCSAFQAECPRGLYALDLGRSSDRFIMNCGDYGAADLYREVARLTERFNAGGTTRKSQANADAYGFLAAGILETLGIEWI